jgi:polyketide synthase 12
VQCDVSQRESVRSLLAEIPSERPLVAVVHTAAALKDSVLLTHESEHIERSFSGKLDGAWHLHELTCDSELSAFVMFSSISGVFGNAGQASYAAANTFLDALAYHRRAQGLPGLSLAWGFWGEKSGLTRGLDDAIIARMERNGVLPMTTEHALAMLDESLGGGDALRVPVRLDAKALRSQGRALPPLLRRLLNARPAAAEPAGDLRQQVAGLSAVEAEQLLLDLVKSAAAIVFSTSKERIDVEREMADLGLDSVMAVELRNRLETATGLRLAATVVLDYPTPIVLAQRLAQALRSEQE